MNLPLIPSAEARRPLASVGRFEPYEHVSTGPDGVAANARVRNAASFVELRYASVAQTNPTRWASIEVAIQVYALLEHPGWVPVVDREVANGTPVLVLEGRDCQRVASTLGAGNWTTARIASFGERLAHALGAAHRIGFIHGAIGPSRVYVTSSGAPLLDFPWLDVGPAATALDRACVAPETGSEAIDASSDVYAVGRLLATLCVGRVPVPGDTFGPLDPLIRSMLSDDREARPAAAEVCLALRALASTWAESDARRTASTIDPTSATLGAVSAGSATKPRRADVKTGDRLGRYHLVSKLGEGGMGQVFRALDLGNGAEAAIKVLRSEASADPEQLRRFRKEARILAEVRSPYVAALLEINHDDGIDYLALEFVDGTDLAAMVEADGGRLSEREALSVVADVCRGLAEAHARGIVHRDIKPENVMIARTDARSTSLGVPRVKLCDFGIARALDERPGTLALTREGGIIGTPFFMAPEQCSAKPVTPATDVYALGITLFSLIAGRMPFNVEEPMAIFVAHVNEVPPTLASVCPEVSEAVSNLVARALAKDPGARFVDASALLEAIERIERGEPTSIAVHPARPASKNRIATHVFEFSMRASPEALWPFISDTDRLNRVVGMAPPSFERTVVGTDVKTTGSNRVAGVDLRWQEYPFEWIEGRRWGVLRVFDRGVMAWFTIEIELLPKPAGGTLIRYTMTLEPKHFLGRLVVAAEMKWKQKPLLDKAFARIDAFAVARSANEKLAAGTDPFAPGDPMTDANRLALDEGLRALRAEGAPGPIVDALASYCVNASAQQVARLRPYQFAREQQLDPEQVVDACLRAAHHGVFVLLWELLCPLCRVPSGFADSLRALTEHAHCPTCNVDFPIDFAQSLELVFRVSSEIRTSEVRAFCVGGPAFSPHVVAQVRLAPAERMSLDLALPPGAYTIRSPQLPFTFPFEVSPAGRARRGSVRFTPRTPRSDERLFLAPRSQQVGIENTLDREIVVRVERNAARQDALTAARASSLASFRRLFPGEVLASGRLVAVGRTAFVVTRIGDQRALLDELGDSRTFELVLRHLAVLEEIAASEGGAVVKTASGVTLSAFESAAAAARAAVALRMSLAGSAATDHPLDVRIAVHQGSTVAATFDGRLDYFGLTVETATELVDRAPSECVLLSSAVAEDAHAMSDLSTAGHAIELTQLDSDGTYGALVRAGRD